jgi:uncharacterized protein
VISVGLASLLSVMIWDKGRWPLGFFVSPRLAVPECARGMAWGFVLISSCAALVVLTTDTRHERGNGFPWLELATVFVPVAIHEELLFRGYVFQKLLRWRRGVAIIGMALVFAFLHGGNEAVTSIGLANIFIGGVLLGLAYERYERLWFPIGLHFAWNVTTSPLLGHEVSGFDPNVSVLVERGGGPEILTGGEFGIEGSVLMTVTELVAVALLIRARRRGIARAEPL